MDSTLLIVIKGGPGLSATNLGKNASLQVRYRGERHRKLVPSTAPQGTPFLSFSFFSFSSFFLLFWLSEMAGSGEKTRRRRATSRRRSALGKKKREPRTPKDQTQNDVVLSGSLIFFLNQNTPKKKSKPQNDIVLSGSLIFFLNQNTPKRCHFGVLIFFFFFLKDTSKMTPLCVAEH